MGETLGSATDRPRVLRVPRTRELRLLAGSVVLAAGAAWMIVRHDDPVAAWLGIAFFGVLGIPALGLLVAAPPRLELDADGFVLHQPLTRTVRRSWHEVGPFTAWTLDPTRTLGPSRPRAMSVVYSTTRTDRRRLRAVSRSLSGGDEGLPSGFDGLSAAELAQLLNGYREAAARRGRGFRS